MFTKKKTLVSLEAKSANIVASIATMRTELIAVNVAIEEERTDNQNEIDSLQARNNELENVAAKNAKIASNIGALLGE